MKRFLVKIICFSLPLLVGAVLLEAYLERMPNIARDKHQWMTAHASEVETLILGHSHNFYGLRPDVLGKGTYNLALPSQTYRYDYYLLTHYLMPRLKEVVLNFDYFQLWEDFESLPDQRFQAVSYLIYMDCKIHSRFSQYGAEILYPPVVRKKLKDQSDMARTHSDSLGWGIEYTFEARADEWDNGEERARLNTRNDTSIVWQNYGFLCDILSWCRKHKVEAIMLNTPVTATFRQYEDPRQKAYNARMLRTLLHDYPEVKYLDLEADTTFNDDDFFDADHLNHEGARKLSLRLQQTINLASCSSIH